MKPYSCSNIARFACHSIFSETRFTRKRCLLAHGINDFSRIFAGKLVVSRNDVPLLLLQYSTTKRSYYDRFLDIRRYMYSYGLSKYTDNYLASVAKCWTYLRNCVKHEGKLIRKSSSSSFVHLPAEFCYLYSYVYIRLKCHLWHNRTCLVLENNCPILTRAN